MLNNYTYRYNVHAKRYYCSKSKKPNLCKSSLKLDDNGLVSFLKAEHNHAPPNYLVTKDGQYIKYWIVHPVYLVLRHKFTKFTSRLSSDFDLVKTILWLSSAQIIKLQIGIIGNINANKPFVR